MKSEPDAFSIDDLKKSRTQSWDGVRNYQARNFMRDQMQVGDLAFFYHSNCTPPGIVGIMQVCKSSHPDFTAFDPDSKYYDSKSTNQTPRWFMVDVAFKRKFSQMITLGALKAETALAGMQLLRKGNRLSILPVTHEEWEIILTMA
jgi:predicted RNA-binding protein with PUA-like domain